MRCRSFGVVVNAVLACVLWANGASPAAEAAKPVPAALPMHQLPERARHVVEHPTLYCQGPSEVFVGRPMLYYWLLDHPDRGAAAWRRLGAPCLGITERGPGSFGYSDVLGSDVTWQTVHRTGGLRIWYAEGKVRPFLFLPTIPVRAVVVLRHTDAPQPNERTLIRHQVDVYVHADSKTAELVTKMLGSSAPKLAAQSITQMEMFFSALVWYIDRHPEQIGLLER